MYKLLFQDVTDDDCNKRILRHFLTESQEQVACRTLMGSEHFQGLLRQGIKLNCVPRHLVFASESQTDEHYSGKRGQAWLKIITDIDDTLECSGGRWPQGLDNRYTRHTTYPGVIAFYKELQGGLVALSARPHFPGDFMETRVFKRFEQLVEKHGLHTMPALLTGSMDAGANFFVSGGGETGLHALAKQKFEKFEQYMKLYPEFRIVFIGDNGQADYAVGLLMVQMYPHICEQVWIHEVQPREKTWRYDAQTSQTPGPNVRIAFFEDYVTAAVMAATRTNPLVTMEGLRRIAAAVVEDFKNIKDWPAEGCREACHAAEQVPRPRTRDLARIRLGGRPRVDRGGEAES